VELEEEGLNCHDRNYLLNKNFNYMVYSKLDKL